MEFRFKTDSITQKMGEKGKKGIFTTFWKIWGVHRCPSLLLSRLKAELSGKETLQILKNAPVSWSELGVEELFWKHGFLGLKPYPEWSWGDEILDNDTTEW